jgi:hypothetical protein
MEEPAMYMPKIRYAMGTGMPSKIQNRARQSNAIALGTK